MKFSTFLVAQVGWWTFYMLFILIAGPPGMPEVVAFYIVVVALCVYFFWTNIQKQRRARQRQ